MAHPRADAGDDQRLIGVRSAEFGHALQLLQAEAGASRFIEPDADCEEAARGEPRPVALIEGSISDRFSRRQYDHEHASPKRKQDAIRRAPGAPVIRARMDEEPVAGNRGVNGANQPSESAQDQEHRYILGPARFTKTCAPGTHERNLMFAPRPPPASAYPRCADSGCASPAILSADVACACHTRVAQHD